VPPASGLGTWDVSLFGLDPAQQHDFIFTKNSGIWNTTTVSLQDCWNNTSLGSFSWTNTVSSYTLSLPANTNIGMGVFSIAPTSTALIDLHNGYCYIDPKLLVTGTTYTVTYVFNNSVCSNVTGKFVITPAHVQLTVSSPTVCLGDSITLTAAGGTSYTWSPGGQSTPSITVTPTVNTTYTVAATVTSCTATSVASSSITVINCSTGLSANLTKEKNINIYPNPNNGAFSVFIPAGEADMYLIQVFNSLGQIIYSDKVFPQGNSMKKTIALPDKSKGIYTVIVQSKQNKFIQKMIVE